MRPGYTFRHEHRDAVTKWLNTVNNRIEIVHEIFLLTKINNQNSFRVITFVISLSVLEIKAANERCGLSMICGFGNFGSMLCDR